MDLRPGDMYHFELKPKENTRTANGYIFNHPEDRNSNGKGYLTVREGQNGIESFEFVYGRSTVGDMIKVIDTKIKEHLNRGV
jgi:hypothetical protein